MNEPYHAPGYPPPPGYAGPVRRQGLGCFARGCITVVILFACGVLLLGGCTWYAYAAMAPFFSTRPVAIRSYPANSAQYSGLLDRFRVFLATLDAQHAAAIAYSADELNDLVACAPSARDLRGKVYFAIANDELISEMSFELPLSKNEVPNQPAYYFNGKVHTSVSFAAGEWTFVFHDLETLDGKPAPALLSLLVKSGSFARGFNANLNGTFQAKINQNPSTAEFIGKIRSVGIVRNRVVINAAER